MCAAFTAAVACGALALPGSAIAAAGFAAPQRLSATADFVDLDGVVVAPTGRTAVMWREADEGKRPSDWRYGEWVAIGPDPAHLGKPTKLALPRSLAREAFQKSLDAFPDGSLVACFQSDPRKGEAVASCAFAPPDGGFGPLREFNRLSWKLRPTFEAFARPDGRVLVVTSQRAKGKRRNWSARLLDRAGNLTAPQQIASAPDWLGASFAAADDGTVVAAWTAEEPDAAGSVDSRWMATLPAGGERFGEPRPLALPDADANSNPSLTGGGPRVVLRYRTWVGERDVERYATVGPDGAISPFVEPRRFTKKGGLSTSVLPLSSGALLGIGQSSLSAALDCDTRPFSQVGVGTLAPATGAAVTGTRLSTPGQIAEYPSAGELGDGTVIVLWGNASREGAEYRLEAAVRPPGAARFGTPQVLPGRVNGWWRFAAGGERAAIVSEVREGAGFDTPEHLEVSAFTSTGPLPAPGKRPKHPSTSCG